MLGNMKGAVKRAGSVATATTAALGLAATFGLGGDAAWAQDVSRYSLATGSPTSGYYRMASPLVEAINKESERLRFTPLSTDGSLENCRRVASGAVKFGMCTTLDIAQAWNGTGAFDSPQRSFRIIGPEIGAIDMYFMVRADSDVQEMKDLAGNSFGCGAPGSSSTQICQSTLELLGLAEDMDILQLPFDQLADMVANRDIVGMARGLVGRPSGFASELNAQTPIRILDLRPLTENSELMAKMPALSPTVISKELYDFLEEDFTTVSLRSFFIVDKDVPEADVEEFARLANSQAMVDRMADAFPGHGLYPKNPEPLAGLLIPLHPGARKFWETTGVEIPEPALAE